MRPTTNEQGNPATSPRPPTSWPPAAHATSPGKPCTSTEAHTPPGDNGTRRALERPASRSLTLSWSGGRLPASNSVSDGITLSGDDGLGRMLAEPPFCATD